jgi:hypothetical protein
MPRGKVDHPAVARLRELADERPRSRRELARLLGVNHSLVIRALAGHPVTQTNARLIEQGLDGLRDSGTPAIDVAFAAKLLRLLQSALESYEPPGKAQTRRRKS